VAPNERSVYDNRLQFMMVQCITCVAFVIDQCLACGIAWHNVVTRAPFDCDVDCVRQANYSVRRPVNCSIVND
jgi:hypothetical protein